MIRINLIPPEYAAAQAQKEQKIIIGVIGGGILALTLMFYGLRVMKSKNLDTQIAQAQAELNELQAIVQQIKAIEEEKKKLIQKRDVILTLNKSRLVYPVFFEDLLPLIPSDLWVNEIRLEKPAGLGGDYKLNCRALSNFALATYISNLEQSPHFNNIKLSAVNYEYPEDRVGGVLNFQINFSYIHQGPMPLTENL